MSFAERTYQRALAALNNRNEFEAERLFKEFLDAQPNHVGALNLLAVVLMSVERYAEAEIYIARAVEFNQSSDVSFYNYGIILKRLNRPTQALEQFNKAIGLNAKVSETWNGRGTVFNDLRQFGQAVSDFDRAISLSRTSYDAFCNKGRSLVELRRYNEAIAAYGEALTLKPDFVHALLGLGDTLFSLKRNDEALAAYDKALALKPDLTEAWLGRGNVLFDRNRCAEALAAYDAALKLKPGFAGAWLGRGNALRDLLQHSAALAAYDEALSLDPELVGAWVGRGNLLSDLKRRDDALAAYDKALALQADVAEAWLGRGNAFFELELRDDALTAHDRALALNPNLAEAWLGRGNVFHAMRRLQDALTFYDKALALKPDLAGAWVGRGNALRDLHRHPDALTSYDKALALRPDLAEAWLGRGNVFQDLHRSQEALTCHDKALALTPELAEAWLGRGNALSGLNQLTEALAAYEKALAIDGNFSEAVSSRIFVLDFAAEAGFEEQQKARSDWWQKIGADIFKRSRANHSNTRRPDRHIKVGYISSDFRAHSAAFAFRPILLNHDRTQFEITCYSCSDADDALTGDFRQAADRWRAVAQSSDDELSSLIQSDQIDILVDLSGHSAGNRLGVFARKSAPIQITAWGHATGTGLPTIDYLFSDPVACPPAVRSMFAEKIYDLPCIISIEPLPDDVRRSNPPVLSKGHITFGVFNRASKLSDEAVAVWARILHAVPRSQILFKHPAFDDAAARNRLLETFTAHGILADRIAFLGSTTRRDHLSAFEAVDISLDPFPQNGGISTWESLQIGVPVVAKLGNSIPSRLAGAIVTSVGLGDWVSDSADGYLAIALKFASMPDHLKTLRLELPQWLLTSASGNSVTYTKAVEAAYRRMWIDYCRIAAG